MCMPDARHAQRVPDARAWCACLMRVLDVHALCVCLRELDGTFYRFISVNFQLNPTANSTQHLTISNQFFGLQSPDNLRNSVESTIQIQRCIWMENVPF